MEEFAKSKHMFGHAFCVRPQDARFEFQSANEEILLIIRAHPITQLPWIFNGLFILILMMLLNLALGRFLPPNQVIIINVFGLAFVLGYYWFHFLSYFFNVGIITNLRVVDVDFHAVIYKEVTEAKLIKVEDITAKTGGYVASLFDFGNVHIQTAGAELMIEFNNVPKPSQIVRLINNITEKA